MQTRSQVSVTAVLFRLSQGSLARPQHMLCFDANVSLLGAFQPRRVDLQTRWQVSVTAVLFSLSQGSIARPQHTPATHSRNTRPQHTLWFDTNVSFLGAFQPRRSLTCKRARRCQSQLSSSGCPRARSRARNTCCVSTRMLVCWVLFSRVGLTCKRAGRCQSQLSSSACPRARSRARNTRPQHTPATHARNTRCGSTRMLVFWVLFSRVGR